MLFVLQRLARDESLPMSYYQVFGEVRAAVGVLFATDLNSQHV